MKNSNILPHSSSTSTDSSSHSGPLPTPEVLQAMPADQLCRPLDPQLFTDLRSMAPNVMNGLMAPSHGATAPSQRLVVASGDAPTPLGIAPPLVSTLLPERRPLKIEDSEVEAREQRKKLRAERNRQSAASSRERKKRHLRELKRRLELLQNENNRMEKEVELARERMAFEQATIDEKDKVQKKLNDSKSIVTELEEKIVNVAVQHRYSRHAKKEDDSNQGAINAQDVSQMSPEAATPQVASPVPAVSPTAGNDGRPKKLRKPRTWDSNALGDAFRDFASGR